MKMAVAVNCDTCPTVEWIEDGEDILGIIVIIRMADGDLRPEYWCIHCARSATQNGAL